MDQYLSTYKKDYVWPSTRLRHASSSLREADSSCICKSSSRELKVINLCGDAQDWSRIGPMGRLLDAKLYPAKTGPSAESEATKFDQPSAYMNKLEEKYPNLYGILQKAPVEEIIKRVDEDRLKTTYQVDYSESGAKSMTDTPTGHCAAIEQPDKQDLQRSADKRKHDIDKGQKAAKKKTVKKEEEESQETRLPPWRSEYQDNIGRLGEAILKARIHQKKKQGPAWETAVL
ncbi:uncharacterized protein LOC114870911 [Osmia bicornis bicornis]|uniref:uncharacterized protein LOC114870911 n=1 Tax=Osmia bicornis bicornis TaxID=1437191 RepID=UPI0010FA5EB7|nr:uncharacterized protein LOC114870911 [Osmia bicornis bicornis]